MDGSAVRTNRAGDVSHQFHLGHGVFEIGRRHRSDYGVAFVATYLRPVSANYTNQAATAFGVSEVSMRNDRAALAFWAHILIVARQSGHLLFLNVLHKFLNQLWRGQSQHVPAGTGSGRPRVVAYRAIVMVVEKKWTTVSPA